MTDDLQTLAVVPRLFPDIRRGAKISTIRWAELRITPGPLRLICGDESLVVTVTRCTDLPLSQAAAFVGRAADWPDEVMLQGMREHYPQITLQDVVQIVEFDPPAA